MAKLTLIYEGMFKVTRTVTIPDEEHRDFIDSHIDKLNLHHPGRPKPDDKTAIEAHLDSIIDEIDKVFSSHVIRKKANEYIKTLPTKRLTHG